MKLVVIDASVVIKWLFPDPAVEPAADPAVALLEDIRRGSVEPLQPPHWLLEVAAVVSRLRPERAAQAVELLAALELPVADDPEILQRAVRLAVDLRHHLFDTLYHAVALEHGALLVTADLRYARKAARHGRLVELADWRV